MSDGACTITGLDELVAKIDQLPATTTARLRAVAHTTAAAVQAKAKEILLSKLKTDRHALADAIALREDADHKQFAVDSDVPSGQPANLPLWIEHGTHAGARRRRRSGGSPPPERPERMAARPYMQPALDSQHDAYVAAQDAAVQDLMNETFGD